MARLSARIARLETARFGAGANRKFAHLSDDELDARLCQIGERLAAKCRGMSVAEITAEIGYAPAPRMLAAIHAETQAPAFDAARFLAAVRPPRRTTEE